MYWGGGACCPPDPTAVFYLGGMPPTPLFYFSGGRAAICFFLVSGGRAAPQTPLLVFFVWGACRPPDPSAFLFSGGRAPLFFFWGACGPPDPPSTSSPFPFSFFHFFHVMTCLLFSLKRFLIFIFSCLKLFQSSIF